MPCSRITRRNRSCWISGPEAPQQTAQSTPDRINLLDMVRDKEKTSYIGSQINLTHETEKGGRAFNIVLQASWSRDIHGHDSAPHLALDRF